VVVGSLPDGRPPSDPTGDAELARLFVEVARLLHGGQDPAGTAERITRAALATVEGCEHAAISLLRRTERPITIAATDDVPVQVDALQYESGQGPCLDAIRDAPVYRTADLAAEDRWPDFAAVAAARTGVRSMLAFRLFVQKETFGALNLYARRPAAFDDHAVAVGAVLAGHAALAVDAARARQRADDLGHALDSNRDIGVAIGILMAQHHIARADAFELLRHTSQWLNRKLRDVADEVNETGELPQRNR
jgi:transcriptional regulator with GAF, ATPase, and Fis domain